MVGARIHRRELSFRELGQIGLNPAIFRRHISHLTFHLLLWPLLFWFRIRFVFVLFFEPCTPTLELV